MKEINLTQGKKTLVDDEKYEFLNQWKWRTNKERHRLYAIRDSKGKKIRMHRLLMDCPADLLVDHRDGDGLNNQMNNLRVCTNRENTRNRRKNNNTTSRYKGVSWNKISKKWTVTLMKNAKNYFIGNFTNELHAAMVHDIWAKELFGEFARLNFPLSPS